MVVLTNKNGCLSCTFVLSTLGTEQMYKECVRYVGSLVFAVGTRLDIIMRD